jgi:hypothetical protein
VYRGAGVGKRVQVEQEGGEGELVGGPRGVKLSDHRQANQRQAPDHARVVLVELMNKPEWREIHYLKKHVLKRKQCA